MMKVNPKLKENQVHSDKSMVVINASQAFIYMVELLGQEQAIEVLKRSLKEHKQMKKVG